MGSFAETKCERSQSDGVQVQSYNVDAGGLVGTLADDLWP